MTEENMQDPDAEGVDWGDMSAAEPSAGYAEPGPAGPLGVYPEYTDNPHNHRFTISIAPDKPPFIVVRGNTAAEITAAFNELESGGVYANCAAAWASLKAQGQIGAGLGPVTPVGPPQAPQGPPAAPQGYGAPSSYPPQGNTPPPFGPNVSVPAAPGYVGPPAPQGGGWGGPPRGGSGPQEKPRPAGWAMVDVPYNDKERFKALRAQGTESGNFLRGKIQWGGKGTYWLDPSVAGWLAQQGFPVMQ